jgi:mRNA-degrading endonuclease RelE of RelBE toxin-antitoxin system
MEWEVRLSSQAKKVFDRLAPRERRRIETTLLNMERDPRGGDTRQLGGKLEGAFRRRVGSWRILFILKEDVRMVIVADIVRRASNTY